MADIMFELVRNVVGTKYEDLTPEAREYAKKSILDTIGVIIAGSSAEGCRAVVDQVREWGGKGESGIWIYGGRAPAPLAALAIGTMARARDLGDIHENDGGHISEYIVPTAFSAAEGLGQVRGRAFMLAVALGQDLGVRLGMSAPRNAASTMAQPSIIFGATAAAGKLSGLDQDTLLNAMGIAYSQARGERQANSDGALTVRLHHGFIAEGAIRSVLFAQKGITGAKNILEGKYGFYKAFAPDHDLARLTAGLGKSFEGAYSSIKLYPCCRFTHGAIDAVMELVKENGIKPHDVAEIAVGISEWASGYVAEPIEIKLNPRNVVDCQFSLPYTVATALVKGSVFIDDFTDEAIKRRDVREIMGIVKPRIDPSLFTPDDPRGGTALLLRTRDGRALEKQVPYIKGNPRNPLTMDEVVEKFRKCLSFAAKPLPRENGERIIGMVADLENIPDVTEIARLLIP